MAECILPSDGILLSGSCGKTCINSPGSVFWIGSYFKTGTGVPQISFLIASILHNLKLACIHVPPSFHLPISTPHPLSFHLLSHFLLPTCSQFTVRLVYSEIKIFIKWAITKRRGYSTMSEHTGNNDYVANANRVNKAGL